MGRPKSNQEKPLTDTELQIMNILWDREGGSVHEVLERLTQVQGKNYAYTTVSTLLRILEKKQVVESQKKGRGHRYIPSIPRENYQWKALDHVVKGVFSGQPTMLIRNLLGNRSLSKEEIEEVQKILTEKSHNE